jgi:hypothetical protein
MLYAGELHGFLKAVHSERVLERTQFVLIVDVGPWEVSSFPRKGVTVKCRDDR